MRELAQLPSARRGPELRSGYAEVRRPPMTRRPRAPQPFTERLVAGEFQHRLVLVLAGVMTFVVLIIVLGGSFFL